MTAPLIFIECVIVIVIVIERALGRSVHVLLRCVRRFSFVDVRLQWVLSSLCVTAIIRTLELSGSRILHIYSEGTDGQEVGLCLNGMRC